MLTARGTTVPITTHVVGGPPDRSHLSPFSFAPLLTPHPSQTTPRPSRPTRSHYGPRQPTNYGSIILTQCRVWNYVMDCPRFEKCNASICPLQDWSKNYHRGSETVCKYSLDSGKAGAAERYQDDPVFHHCVSQLPAISERYPTIANQVEKASKTGFRGGHLMR